MTSAGSSGLDVRRFGYSAPERMLFDQARMIATHHAPQDHRALTPDGLRAVFRELATLGYFGSILPIAAGGSGLSGLEFAALVEGIAPELTLLGNHSVQRYLYEFATPKQRERFLPALLDGEELGAIAITEPGAGSNLGGIATTAKRTTHGYVLSGRKTWVTHGLHAGLFIVLARVEGADADAGLTRFIVPGDTPELTRRALDTVGLRHLGFAEIEFDACELSADLRLGEEGEGASGARSAFPIARALAALQALRIAETALEHLALYSRDRMIATGPLSASPLLQDRYADLATRCEAARLLALKVMNDLADPAATIRASGLKALACSLALETCRWAADTMGSVALDAAHPIQRLLADARMMAVVDGTPVLNNLVVGRRVLRAGSRAVEKAA